MDKTKKVVCRVLTACVILLATEVLHAQDISQIQFCGKTYVYEENKDSLTLFFNLLDKNGKRVSGYDTDRLSRSLQIYEDGEQIDKNDNAKVLLVNSGQRIPSEYTFSVLVDLGIPEDGKSQIYAAIEDLIDLAPCGCVYLSFFGDEVTSTIPVNKKNYESEWNRYNLQADKSLLYDGVYAKLAEFSDKSVEKEHEIKVETGYAKNVDIASRAKNNQDKNVLIVFTGNKLDFGDDIISTDLRAHQSNMDNVVPRVYMLYYKQGREEVDESLLKFLCSPKNGRDSIPSRSGKYMPASDMDKVIENFQEIVSEAMYDYAFKYRVNESRSYLGKVTFSGRWNGNEIGEEVFSVGTEERPWPIRTETVSDVAIKYLYAMLVAIGTIAFFFVIMKIIVPYIRSKSFALKYYRKYTPEPNVSRRICHYCKQDIQPGQSVVTKCKHIMHVSCWQQNGYKCAEYGQNCKDGIQSHIDWKHLFTLSSFRDCSQTISGIVAGFISWIFYDLIGKGLFNGISESIVSVFYGNLSQNNILYQECINKTSAFLTIGLLLGFFLSLIFRKNDEYKTKDAKIWGKIVALSLLTGVIGMLAFAIGAIILCLLLVIIETTFLPWYCSFPAYLIFSISVSLALTIKSTIPVKSALIGGLCSAVIGFFVLYCSSQANNSSGWMNMLLDFIIYGGGLGVSLVTVRMLAEKYFLVIQNGVKAGQRIPIHKWMNALGGGNKVTIGLAGECEIQMNWEKSNRVAQEHVQLFIDYDKQLPILKPLDTGVIYNARAELPVGIQTVLSNGDNFKIGDTIFCYEETE